VVGLDDDLARDFGVYIVDHYAGSRSGSPLAMPTNPEPITLFDVVQRAVEIADPTNTNGDLGELLLQFEDADEPVTALDGLDKRVAEAAARVDPEIQDPGISMAAAMILYLAYRRDELGDAPDKIMRLAARAEWKGDPPTVVREWLADRGVEV
jgi:hypothetical protein